MPQEGGLIHMDTPFPPVGFNDAVGGDSGGSYDSSKSSRLPFFMCSKSLVTQTLPCKPFPSVEELPLGLSCYALCRQ